jgi:hypothetical protein
MKFIFCRRRGADGRTAYAGAGGGGNSVLAGASLLTRGRRGGEEPHTQPLTPTPAPTTEVRGYTWAMELGFLSHIRKSRGFGILWELVRYRYVKTEKGQTFHKRSTNVPQTFQHLIGMKP